MIRFLEGFAAGGLLCGSLAFWLFWRARRAFGRLLAFGIHEINSPITAVNMMILNFRSGVFGELQESQKEWMELMREQTGRLNGMMGELRDLVGLELDGEFDVSCEEMELPPAIETALLSIRTGAARSKVGIRVELEPALPKVRADGDRLARTIVGVLYHARKFRISGDIRVKAGASEPGRPLELRVEYAGPKLSGAEARRALALFYPARRRDRLLSATGFGLGMARIVMRRQGGDLRFNVDADGRSHLLLEIPLAR